MHELRGEPEPSLHEQLVRFSPCDLVLVEGYKHAAIPKLEVHRPGLAKPLLHPDDPNIVAVATDATIETRLPLLDLNRPDEIADFIIDHLDRVHEARIAAVR
jgi:molybdopterin-guanine dinucleotide biosynthesis protein B